MVLSERGLEVFCSLRCGGIFSGNHLLTIRDVRAASAATKILYFIHPCIWALSVLWPIVMFLLLCLWLWWPFLPLCLCSLLCVFVCPHCIYCIYPYHKFLYLLDPDMHCCERGFLCILGAWGQLLNLVHQSTQSVNYGGKWILCVCLCVVNFVVACI